MEEIRKPNILIIVLAAILVLTLALCGYLWTAKNNAEKAANEYKASYEALAEEQRESADLAEQYKASYEALVDLY